MFGRTCALLSIVKRQAGDVAGQRTAVLPKIPHSNSCKRVPNRPLRPRRGRFRTLLQQLECGIIGKTAVGRKKARPGRFWSSTRATCTGEGNLFFSVRVCIVPCKIPGTCVQYPGLQGGGALGGASTPGTPAGSMAASALGGTHSYVAVVGRVWGGEKGAASATAAAAARRRRATPTGGAVTLPRSAPAHGGRGGRHGARAGRWDRPPRNGAPPTAPLGGVSNHHPQQKPARRHDRLRVIVAGSNPGCRCARSPCATRGGGGGAGAGAVLAQ